MKALDRLLKFGAGIEIQKKWKTDLGLLWKYSNRSLILFFPSNCYNNSIISYLSASKINLRIFHIQEIWGHDSYYVKKPVKILIRNFNHFALKLLVWLASLVMKRKMAFMCAIDKWEQHFFKNGQGKLTKINMLDFPLCSIGRNEILFPSRMESTWWTCTHPRRFWENWGKRDQPMC